MKKYLEYYHGKLFMRNSKLFLCNYVWQLISRLNYKVRYPNSW